MLRYLRKSKKLTIYLACLFLLTSSGLALDVHFCKEKPKVLGFFFKAKNCQGDYTALSCEERNKNNACNELGRKKCCANKSFFYKLITDNEISENVEIRHSALFPSHIIKYIFLLKENLLSYNKYFFAQPPIALKMLRSWLQVQII